MEIFSVDTAHGDGKPAEYEAVTTEMIRAGVATYHKFSDHDHNGCERDPDGLVRDIYRAMRAASAM